MSACRRRESSPFIFRIVQDWSTTFHIAIPCSSRTDHFFGASSTSPPSSSSSWYLAMIFLISSSFSPPEVWRCPWPPWSWPPQIIVLTKTTSCQPTRVAHKWAGRFEPMSSCAQGTSSTAELSLRIFWKYGLHDGCPFSCHYMLSYMTKSFQRWIWCCPLCLHMEEHGFDGLNNRHGQQPQVEQPLLAHVGEKVLEPLHGSGTYILAHTS
jgi:hypothetical protein